MSEPTKGDLVATCKGAAFRGIVLATYEKLDGSQGAVVEALDTGFEGTTHVYALGQLVVIARGEMYARKLRRTGT